MLYLSKLGKNVVGAISNMKESNASLQAKVWIKLASCSSQVYQQFSAYTKAIELLRKDNNIQVIEVLIQFAQWLHQNHYSSGVIISFFLKLIALGCRRSAFACCGPTS